MKDKIMSLSNTNATKDYSKSTRVNKVYGGREKTKIKKKDKQKTRYMKM